MPTNNETLLQALNEALILSQAVEQYQSAKALIDASINPEGGAAQTQIIRLTAAQGFGNVAIMMALPDVETEMRSSLNGALQTAVTTKLGELETQLSEKLAVIATLDPAPEG